MTSVEAALRKVTGELDDAHVPFALIGGLAVSVRTEPRFTRDADVAVALATDAEAEALIDRLRSRGHGIDAIDLLPHFTMRVARVKHLIALKVLSRDDEERPQDIGDLRALLRVASPSEIECARRSLALIAARGYHRGRNLPTELNRLLRDEPAH